MDFDKFSPGRLAPPDLEFCPILALSKFPYKFIEKKSMQSVATEFFDGGKFWDRKWNL
jgi:hypothetical protein